MTGGITFEDQLRDTIRTAVEKHVNDVMQEEVDDAKRRIERRIRESVAHVALSVVSNYSVQSSGTEIVIRVENRQ